MWPFRRYVHEHRFEPVDVSYPPKGVGGLFAGDPAPRTMVLLRCIFDGELDTRTLDGKWTIEQVRGLTTSVQPKDPGEHVPPRGGHAVRVPSFPSGGTFDAVAVWDEGDGGAPAMSLRLSEDPPDQCMGAETDGSGYTSCGPGEDWRMGWTYEHQAGLVRACRICGVEPGGQHLTSCTYEGGVGPGALQRVPSDTARRLYEETHGGSSAEGGPDSVRVTSHDGSQGDTVVHGGFLGDGSVTITVGPGGASASSGLGGQGSNYVAGPAATGGPVPNSAVIRHADGTSEIVGGGGAADLDEDHPEGWTRPHP